MLEEECLADGDEERDVRSDYCWRWRKTSKQANMQTSKQDNNFFDLCRFTAVL